MMDTVPKMFWHGVKARAGRTIFRQKEFGIWRAVTWDELGRIAREIGSGLASLGYAPGEVVSILSNTRKEWVYADLGALGAAGVVNGIYPTDAPAQAEYLLSDSGSTFVFVEDDEQLDKVLEVRERLPRLRKIFVFDMEGLHELNDPQVMSLDVLRALGREYDAAHPDEWERRISLRKPEDLAILVYTSGTTGKPKGAMISHRNVIQTVRSNNETYQQDERDERMCFLPLCHIAERVLGAYTALSCGAKLNFVENPETVPENVREIAPTVFGAVPRIWEKFYSGVLIGLKQAGALPQWAYSAAIAIGYRQAKLREEGKSVPATLRLAFWLARLLVLNNVRKAIGVHRARLLITGAAPISPDLVRWYMALGLEMIEVWGQTESCGIGTNNLSGRTKPGSIAVTSVSVRLLTDESSSEQVAGAITRAESGFPAISYNYRNKPQLELRQTRSPIHYGAAVIEIEGRPATGLNGEYWTDRNSSGKFTFREHAPRVAQTFEQATTLAYGAPRPVGILDGLRRR